MTEFKVPSWFRKQLLDGEEVIAKSGHFYVTNQRLLRLLNSINNGLIEYNKISNITYEKYGVGRSVLRSIFVIFGLALIIIGIIIFLITSRVIQYGNPEPLPLWPFLFIWFGGSFFIILAVTMKKYYYQICGTDIDKKTSVFWRIDKSRKTEELITILSEKTGKSIEK